MTHVMPGLEQGSSDGLAGQILLALKDDIASIKTDVAVIKRDVQPISDHEMRLRQLEQAAAADKGVRDVWARGWAAVAAAAAAGSGAAAWVAVAHIHR